VTGWRSHGGNLAFANEKFPLLALSGVCEIAMFGTFYLRVSPSVWIIVATLRAKQRMFDTIEEQVRANVEWLRLLVEALGATVIAFGVVTAIIGLIRHALVARGTAFTPIRLTFARYLALALELQLAADVLSTSVAPTWDRIGKLMAIAVIRTALNYFLGKEIKEERASEDITSRQSPSASRDSAGEGAP
jgi:uncharacterized membrane protein